MFKEVQLSEIDENGFLHSYINEFSYEVGKKFIIKLSHADLKNDGALFYNCTITITDWLDFEVFEYNSQQYMKQFNLNEIPEIEQIFQFLFEDNELTLICMGLHRDTSIKYKFINPKINITGEYEPD